jgi:hypothetical protein
MKIHGVTKVCIHGFYALAVYRGQWSGSHPEERVSSTNAIGEYVHVTAGLKAVKKRSATMENQTPIPILFSPWPYHNT